MQVGKLYSCKWIRKSKAFYGQTMERLLLFLGTDSTKNDCFGNPHYMFFDLLRCERVSLPSFMMENAIITKETTCTQ